MWNLVEDCRSALLMCGGSRRQAVHASCAAAAAGSAAPGRAGAGCKRAAAGVERALGQRRTRHQLYLRHGARRRTALAVPSRIRCCSGVQTPCNRSRSTESSRL